ncbi:MAG TPA: extracellular solute-binding protein [Egibacteraceae bacterium]|nr:extracellular solute-binding protein [Egibacteraceae bacterium]
MRVRHPLWALMLAIAMLMAACATGEDLPETAPGEEAPPEETAAGETPADDTAAPDDAPADDLVTLNRIGAADAPNSFTMQITQGHSHEAPTEDFAGAFRTLFQQWAEDNPDWRVDLEIIPAEAVTAHMAVLLEQSRAGRAPDCAEVDSFVIAQFIDVGVLQPLNDHFSQEEIDALMPFVRDVVVDDEGSLRAYWWNTDLRVLYYRTDLMPEAPQTWDELIEVASSVAQENPGTEGFLFNGGRWEAATFDNLAHFWAQGGDLIDADGRPIFGEGDNREYMLSTLEFLRELVDSGAAPERVSTILEYNEFNTAAQAGTVASFLGGHWQHGQLQDILSEEDFALWDFDRIPGPTEDQRSTGTGGWTIGVFSEDPAIQEACADLIRSVYMGPANEAVGQLPTSTILFEELPAFQEEPFLRFGDFLEEGRSRPGVPVYPSISEQIQVAVGQVLTGELTPEEAVDQSYQASLDAYEDLQ